MHAGVLRKTGLEGEGEEPSRVLMNLIRGTASFQIETGRWKGVPREERLCREYRTNGKWKTAVIVWYLKLIKSAD